MGQYVIYARKSTESDDRQVLSIDSQVRELRQLAERHGVAVSEVLTESRSAKAPGRPVFADLVRRIHRGEVSGVLCWKMDRLARNPYDSGLILQAQADGQLERIIASDGIKTADGNDRLMGSFELAIAAKFIDDLRANVKRGNRARFEKGWPNYRPPLGYLNDRATKTIVKDPERFAVVRKMWDMLLQGIRPKEIARVAREDWGLRSPRRGKTGGTLLSYSSAYRIFVDRYYAGYIDLEDGRQYLGAHEPMVSLDEFERTQQLLGRRAHPHATTHENPLAGIVRCGNCGCAVIAEFHTKRGRRYVYHRCCRSKPGVRCREKPLSEAQVGTQIAEYFRRLAIPEPILAFLRQKLDAFDAGEAGLSAQVTDQRERALAGLEREERELLSLRVRQLIDDETFTRERNSLRERRVSLQRPAAAIGTDTSESQARANALSDKLDLVEGGPTVVREGTPFQLRSLLVGLQLEITLRGRRLDFTASEPLATLVRAASNSNWQAQWPELWKWLMYGDASAGSRPSDDECRIMMAEQERLAQKGGDPRRRYTSG